MSISKLQNSKMPLTARTDIFFLALGLSHFLSWSPSLVALAGWLGFFDYFQIKCEHATPGFGSPSASSGARFYCISHPFTAAGHNLATSATPSRRRQRRGMGGGGGGFIAGASGFGLGGPVVAFAAVSSTSVVRVRIAFVSGHPRTIGPNAATPWRPPARPSYLSHIRVERVSTLGAAAGRPTAPDPPLPSPAGQPGSMPRRGRSVRPARAGQSEHHGRAGGRDQNSINREHLQVRNVSTSRNRISRVQDSFGLILVVPRAFTVDCTRFHRGS